MRYRKLTAAPVVWPVLVLVTLAPWVPRKVYTPPDIVLQDGAFVACGECHGIGRGFIERASCTLHPRAA